MITTSAGLRPIDKKKLFLTAQSHMDWPGMGTHSAIQWSAYLLLL